jgi:hypothetical protein
VILVMSRWLLAMALACWAISSAAAEDAPRVTRELVDIDPAAARHAMAARVDALIGLSCHRAGVQLAAPADDAEFARRAYLDLTGVIPRVAQIREFLDDPQPDKRTRLVDQLVLIPAHATHLANTWRNIMLPEGLSAEQINNVAGVQNWLRMQFVENMRYDRVVSDFLVATGGGDRGPAQFYTAQELKPEKLAAATARIFLGLQIECAECHDHPFDRWKQEDFWAYAAFFARLQRPDRNTGQTAAIVELDRGEVTLPDSSTPVPPRYPGASDAVGDERGSRRVQLAIWMASRDNPYLARAAVNRVWSHLFGRGLVEPVDDLGEHNPPSHPELFEELTQYFVDTGFDLRQLTQMLAYTATYQRTSRSDAGDATPPHRYASMAVRPLTPEQLYDSLDRALLRRAATADNPLFDPQRQAFVARMQSGSRSATEYEAGVPQALMLMNGAEITSGLNAPQGMIVALEAPWLNDEQRIETLFLATLSRRPASDEQATFLVHVQAAQDAPARRQAMGDLLWALLNSAEFAMNH